MILIGIDPGTETGYAEWHTTGVGLQAVEAMTLYLAQHRVRGLHAAGAELLVVLEDARKHRVWKGAHAKKGAKILQGVGSVKRDCSLWVEFCEEERIPYTTVRPRRRATKKNAKLFQEITGWKGRTNEHGRDAAMFVYNINQAMAAALLREALAKVAA